MVATTRTPSHFLITLEFLECISWHNYFVLDPSTSLGMIILFARDDNSIHSGWIVISTDRREWRNLSQTLLYGSYDFLNEERLSLHLVALSIIELRHHSAEIVYKMTAVELAY